MGQNGVFHKNLQAHKGVKHLHASFFPKIFFQVLLLTVHMLSGMLLLAANQSMAAMTRENMSTCAFEKICSANVNKHMMPTS